MKHKEKEAFMPVSTASTLGPLDLIGAALSSPLVSLLVSSIIAVGVVLVGHRTGRTTTRLVHAVPASVRRRYTPEHRALGTVAGTTVIVFIAEFVIRGYVLTGPALWWWRVAVPLTCAVIGAGIVLLVISTRGTRPPQTSVFPSTRRTWISFSSRSTLTVAAFVLLVLVATTVAAGAASSPNGEGQHVWLTIPVPNEATIDPIRTPFYGWTYGVPVLCGVVALIAALWAVLDRNAARPLIRPETVAAERAARRETARHATLVATAAGLLTLAGAWRLIARAGSGTSLTISSQNGDATYEAAWRFAELAVAAGWCAPLLEISALTLLLVITAKGLRPTSVTREPSAPMPAPADATTVL